MNIKKLLLWFVLLDFGLFSAWVVWDVGYLAIWQAGFTSPASLQILLDLVICASLICGWIIQDARRRGANPWPWVLGVVLAGSLVPLAYLLWREPASKPQTAAAQVGGA